jgi:hypothetical protein
VAEFHRQLIVLRVVYKWDFTAIFDGCPPPQKAPEHQRRRAEAQKKDDNTGISITSEYIALCAHACKRYFHKFVVAPAEADMQACRRDPSAVAVCRDSDLIAYGLPFVVIVDDYAKEEFRVIDMTIPLSLEIKEKYPLYWYYKKYGIRVIHWWAAVLGCDISIGPRKVGLIHFGRKAFLDALASFDDNTTVSLDSKSFAAALRNCGKLEARATHSVKQIQDELDRVEKWFSKDGSYYDIDGNHLTVSGDMIMTKSRTTIRHMNGELDPKTRGVFSTSQQKLIDSLKPHNLKHNSEADSSAIHGKSLPPYRARVQDCLVDELKGILICRGGNLTDRDGNALNKSELCKIATAHLLLEKENQSHTIFFNRTRSNNGVFANIDTSERRTVPQMLNAILRAGEVEPNTMQMVTNILELQCQNKFTDDFATIALHTPELQQDFIFKEFAHIGDSTHQKDISEGLKRVLEMDRILYHSIAWAPDGKSIYIVSKQRASMCTDDKTRKKTATGEKGKFKEYLVMLQVAIEQTTDTSHGHTLGICVRVMRSCCAGCKAGCGLCYHRACVLWMQHLHWGEGRPTPKPATASFCSWIPGCRDKRSCSTVMPASKCHREKLPTSNEEAEQKLKHGNKRGMNDGVPAIYNFHAGRPAKMSLFDDPRYISADRLAPLFLALRDAQKK